MSQESNLTEQEKEKIRLKEQFRNDIQQKQKSRIWWINAPITIWLLSAVVAGLVPYTYSKHQERVQIEKEDRELRREAAESLLSEIEFRLAQFNKVLDRTRTTRQEAVAIADDALLDVISGNRLSATGKKLRALFSSAAPLRVVSELGGIYAIPRTDEGATVWIGESGWGISSLPDGRGYRDEKFINDSVLSLWNRYMTMSKNGSLPESRVSEVKALFEDLANATMPNEAIESLSRISSNALTMREWSESVDMREIVELRASTIAWIQGVDSAWQKIDALFRQDG